MENNSFTVHERAYLLDYPTHKEFCVECKYMLDHDTAFKAINNISHDNKTISFS